MIFTKYRPNEFAKIAGGGTPSTSNNNYWNGEIPWITPKDLSGYNFKWIAKGERNITEEGLRNSSAKLLPENTVLLSSRAPVGYLAIAKNLISTNQGFKSLICNEEIADYNFIYYLLVNNRHLLISRAGGATFGELSAKRLSEIEFNLPPLPTQRKIASILSAYDDLIENNLKRIKLLEEKAQLHYKELMQDSAKWDKVKLGEFVSVVKGRKPANVLEQLEDDCQLYLLLDTVERTKTLYTSDPNLPIAKESDVLMCMDGARSGLSFRGMTGAIGSTMAIWRSNSERVSGEFLYQFMKQNESAITQGNTGAAIPHANRKFILDMEIAIPSNEEAEDFDRLTLPIIKLINTLHNQNTKLREARDILLPRLMSGEMEV